MNAQTEVTDDNGNRCTIAYWGSIKAAKAALATLSDCSDCLNCLNCSRCSRCSYCSSCLNCSRCSRCSNCSDCSAGCIVGPTRSDGYTFFLSEERHVKAGCRDFTTFAEARGHWQKTRAGTALGIETECILQCLEQLQALKEREK